MMMVRPNRICILIDKHIPVGTTGRKVAMILSVILVFEGISVLFLFSYAAALIGLVSLVVGFFMLLVLRAPSSSTVSDTDTPGVRLVEYIFNMIGGEYVMMTLGAALILAVFGYNSLFSSSPGIGDSDSLSIMFGIALMSYPLIYDRYRIEATFALIFIGSVMALLVVPRVWMSTVGGGSASSAVSDSYVHYMLAAPFSWILDIIGIPSSSTGNVVTIQLQDGSVHALAISAYCAGLYSFSIFLSAFFAFVLVFENLRKPTLVMVLALGLIVAYLGNLLRMVVIGIVGYYYGIDALHQAHENAGWIIFLAWSCLFWWLILGFVSKSRFQAPRMTANQSKKGDL